MSRRLFVFLLVLVGTLLSGVIAGLLLFGVVGSGTDDAEALIASEQTRATDALQAELGDVSVEAVLLSRSLTQGVEDWLLENGAAGASPVGAGLAPPASKVSRLSGQADALESLLAAQVDTLALSLERSGAGGVFVVLDATVNPAAADAKVSRAGLYLRASEPSVAGDNTLLYLRGFPQIAYDRRLSFQSVWDMEFDAGGASWYEIPIETARSRADLPLSRLYRWGFGAAADGLGENTLLCSIPLVASDGAVFGICGFEIGAAHFRLNDAPGLASYPNAVLILAEDGTDVIRADASLCAGGKAVFGSGGGASLAFAKRAGGLDLYQAGAAGDVGYVGLGGPLRLYADDSPYAGESFSVTLAVPEADYARERRAETWRIVLVFATLCAVGIALSIILHRRFMKPITESLAAFEAGEEASFAHFPELAAIMERMSELKSEGAPIPAGLFGGFIGAAKALTPTERVIFEYYADGKTAEEILRYMFIAPPTLKTHNRHIYAKLGVTSLSEMLLYVDLIKKAGLYKEIIGK